MTNENNGHLQEDQAFGDYVFLYAPRLHRSITVEPQRRR